MNKVIMAVIALVVLAGGGYYFYSQQNSSSDLSLMDDVAVEDNSITDDAVMGEESNTEDDSTMEDKDASMAQDMVEFTVEGSGFKYEPNTLTVKEGQTVKVTFKNLGGMHDFVIDEFDVATSVISTSESDTIEFVADKKGEYTFYCSVPGHREKGMEGTLIVE